MTPPRRVLLTGAAGRLGSVLRQRLNGRFDLLRVSDIKPLDDAAPGEEIAPCDLADAKAVARLCHGIDAVIHLGAIAGMRPWTELLGPNITGTINIFEAARNARVRRVLFASSNHVVGLYPVGEQLDETSPPRPDSAYGTSKAFGEALAAHYAHKHGISTFCMRIGTCRSLPDSQRALSTWLSFDDLGRLVTTGLTASYLCEIVYGVSRNRRSWWSNERAYALGYSPEDDAEAYAAQVAALPPDDERALLLQGGLRAASTETA